jgi:hypothetical protein
VLKIVRRGNVTIRSASKKLGALPESTLSGTHLTISLFLKGKKTSSEIIMVNDKPIGPAALPPKDRQTVSFLVYFLCNVCTFVDVRIRVE